jgi:hypothetical protein
VVDERAAGRRKKEVNPLALGGRPADRRAGSASTGVAPPGAVACALAAVPSTMRLAMPCAMPCAMAAGLKSWQAR